MKYIKYLFILLLFLIICSEQILDFLPPIASKPLSGAYVIPTKPKLSLHNWFNGTFQDSLTSYFEYNLKLHNFFVRCNNEINFMLFKQPGSKSVICGKNNQLFEKYYIESYLGNDYIGEDTIKKRVSVLSKVQQELASRNISLITLITPSKPSIYPEDLPDFYTKFHRKKTTNYDTYIKEFKKQNINLIDFKNYFISIKSKKKYELYSNLGTHWNGYGVSIAIDSLVKYLEHKRNIKMVEIIAENGKVTREPVYYDHDLKDLMNLFHDLPSRNLYYPKITFKSDSSKYKPNTLIIGDSFSWALIHTYPFFQNLFDINSEFWYYNKSVGFKNSGDYSVDNWIEALDPYQKNKNRDFIILLFNENNLKEFDFNFSRNMSKSLGLNLN